MRRAQAETEAAVVGVVVIVQPCIAIGHLRAGKAEDVADVKIDISAGIKAEIGHVVRRDGTAVSDDVAIAETGCVYARYPPRRDGRGPFVEDPLLIISGARI